MGDKCEWANSGVMNELDRRDGGGRSRGRAKKGDHGLS